MAARFANTFDGRAELSGEAAKQGLNVDLPGNKRESVRAGDESGEASNARRSVQQDIREHCANTLGHVLREDGESQSSHGGNRIVTQEAFENGTPMFELCIGRDRSHGTRADHGIGIVQGNVDERTLDCSPVADQQLVHHPADRCGEARSTRKSVVPTIRQQDSAERSLNFAVVASPLSKHADNEGEGVEYDGSVVRSQTTRQKFAGPRGDGFHPVVDPKGHEWDFPAITTLRQHLECGRTNEAVCV
jgi:hypothetical protein